MRTAADDELMLPALRKYSLISYVPGALKTSVIDTGTGFFSISSSSVSATYPSTDLLSTRYAVNGHISRHTRADNAAVRPLFDRRYDGIGDLGDVVLHGFGLFE